MSSLAKRVAARIERFLFSKKKYKFLIKDWVALGDLNASAAVIGAMRFSRNFQPIELPGPGGRKALVIAPHPDDEILGPGGTLIRSHGESGAQVHVLYLTTGKPELADAMKSEAVAVSQREGFTTSFMDLALNAIPLDQTTLDRFLRVVESVEPDVI